MRMKYELGFLLNAVDVTRRHGHIGPWRPVYCRSNHCLWRAYPSGQPLLSRRHVEDRTRSWLHRSHDREKRQRSAVVALGRTRQFATMPFDGSVASPLEQSMAHEIGRETIGTEVLDGHPTTVFQITAREGQREVIYYQWWAEDLHLPLRIARKDGAWIVEYKNLKLRSLSPRLFEIPLTYRPIESSLGSE